MAMQWPQRPEDSGPIPISRGRRAVIFIPGHDLHLEQRRVLLHCDQRGYEVVALAQGERSWAGARTMLRLGEADVIVTVSRSGHTTEPGVEVAGAGRTTVRTPHDAERLRAIATLVESGLAVEEIVRILRASAR